MMLLKERREFLGMTQEGVGQKVGISKQTYSAIERGDTALPDLETRRAISRVLGIRHIELLVAQGIIEDWEVPGFDATAPEPDPQIEALVHLVRTLDLAKNDRKGTLTSILQFWASEDDPPAR